MITVQILSLLAVYGLGEALGRVMGIAWIHIQAWEAADDYRLAQKREARDAVPR